MSTYHTRSRGADERDLLLAMVERLPVIMSPEGIPYFEAEINGRKRVIPATGPQVRLYLRQQYLNQHRRTVSGAAIADAAETIEARAMAEGKPTRVYLRIAHHHGDLYLDHGDSDGNITKVTPGRVEIVQAAPVSFARGLSMGVLPPPRLDDTERADELLNSIFDFDDPTLKFLAIASCLGMLLLPEDTYPVLSIMGPPGSGKSVFAGSLKTLIDPSPTKLRGLPRDELDLMIAAGNGHVLAFDNVRRLSDWTSDALCRLTSGTSWGTKQLYSNRDENLFCARRPIIVTSTGQMARRLAGR